MSELKRKSKKIGFASDPEFVLTNCGPEWAQKALEIRTEIYENLSDKHMLIIEMTDDVFRHFFMPPHIVRGALVQGELVGYVIASFRSEALSKFYKLLGFSPERNNIAYLEFSMVQADFRGHGLAKKILGDLDRFLLERGLEYACAIASPDNYPSVRSLNGVGYRTVKRFIHQPSGYVRDMFIKKLVSNEDDRLERLIQQEAENKKAERFEAH